MQQIASGRSDACPTSHAAALLADLQVVQNLLSCCCPHRNLVYLFLETKEGLAGMPTEGAGMATEVARAQCTSAFMLIVSEDDSLKDNQHGTNI